MPPSAENTTRPTTCCDCTVSQPLSIIPQNVESNKHIQVAMEAADAKNTNFKEKNNNIILMACAPVAMPLFFC